MNAAPKGRARSPQTNDHDTAHCEEVAAEVWSLEVDITRVIRDDDLSPDVRQHATADLLARARASSEPELALRSMEYAVGRDIDELLDEDPGFGDPVERRLEQLHLTGETTCGRCLRPVPDPSVVSWWRARRAAATWRPERRAS